MLRKIKLRHQFPENYDTNEAGDDSGINTGSEGGAQQQFKDECDINVMLKQYGIGYELPKGLRVPTAGDFTGVNNFHEAMNAIRQTQETFELLPAHIRSKFQNDPGQFADFATNDENREQIKKWGMLSPEALERDRIAQEQRITEEQAKTTPNGKSAAKGPQAPPASEEA